MLTYHTPSNKKVRRKPLINTRNSNNIYWTWKNLFSLKRFKRKFYKFQPEAELAARSVKAKCFLVRKLRILKLPVTTTDKNSFTASERKYFNHLLSPYFSFLFFHIFKCFNLSLFESIYFFLFSPSSVLFSLTTFIIGKFSAQEFFRKHSADRPTYIDCQPRHFSFSYEENSVPECNTIYTRLKSFFFFFFFWLFIDWFYTFILVCVSRTDLWFYFKFLFFCFSSLLSH